MTVIKNGDERESKRNTEKKLEIQNQNNAPKNGLWQTSLAVTIPLCRYYKVTGNYMPHSEHN
jgi:hypothetical protein